jgi:hypothetical protein
MNKFIEERRHYLAIKTKIKKTLSRLLYIFKILNRVDWAASNFIIVSKNGLKISKS